MSARIVDVRVARPGWHVATVNIDDDAGVVQRVFPLVGWAICRTDDDQTVVAPCWHEPGHGGVLFIGDDDDAGDVLPPGAEPDWHALRAEARAVMLRREGLR